MCQYIRCKHFYLLCFSFSSAKWIWTFCSKSRRYVIRKNIKILAKLCYSSTDKNVLYTNQWITGSGEFIKIIIVYNCQYYMELQKPLLLPWIFNLNLLKSLNKQITIYYFFYIDSFFFDDYNVQWYVQYQIFLGKTVCLILWRIMQITKP